MAAPPTTALLAALALGAAGCGAGRGAPPCTPGACGPGAACVAGRCRAGDAGPAPADAARLVVAPAAIAVVSARGGDPAPESFTLGRAADGRVVVLLRFEPALRADAIVQSAFLVVDPLEGAPPAGGATAVEVARVLDPWDPATVSWGRLPRLAASDAAAVAPALPSPPLRAAAPAAPGPTGAASASLALARTPLRLDVTEIVRRPARGRAHGLALTSAGDDAVGATFSTGLTRGRPPRLEIFVK